MRKQSLPFSYLLFYELQYGRYEDSLGVLSIAKDKSRESARRYVYYMRTVLTVLRLFEIKPSTRHSRTFVTHRLRAKKKLFSKEERIELICPTAIHPAAKALICWTMNSRRSVSRTWSD